MKLNKHFTEALFEDLDDSEVLFHGSQAADIEQFNTPITWLTPSEDYANSFATALKNKGYVYKCKLTNKNKLFNVGITNNPIYSILPTSNQFSAQFKEIIERLALSNEEVNRLVMLSAREFGYTKNSFGKYSRGAKALPLFNICRTDYFKELLIKRGYKGVKAQEFDNRTNKYYTTIGVFEPQIVDIVDKDEVVVASV